MTHGATSVHWCWKLQSVPTKLRVRDRFVRLRVPGTSLHATEIRKRHPALVILQQPAALNQAHLAPLLLAPAAIAAGQQGEQAWVRARRHLRDAAWRSWALPLAAGALARAAPAAPPQLWLRAALLASQVPRRRAPHPVSPASTLIHWPRFVLCLLQPPSSAFSDFPN